MSENKDRKLSSASIDGIISRQGSGLNSGAYQPSRGAPTPSLGNFGQAADGFHPNRASGTPLSQTPKSVEADLLEEPILLDQSELKKPKTKQIGYLRRHPKLKLGIKRLAITVSAVVLAGGLYMGYNFYATQKNLFRGGGFAPALADCQDINQLRQEGDCRVNILILGVGGEGHSGQDLTDTLMIASIDPINNKADLLSIPRDLWVRIPGNGSQKINAAYTYGIAESDSDSLPEQQKHALELINKTLEPVLGIPIHYHAVINFQAFKQVVNALGGITVNVPEQLYDPTIAWENGYDKVIAKAGPQNFNGAKALLYVKSRETSSDFARGERQRLVLVALKDKATSVGTFSNPVKVSQLLSALGRNVYTDFSLDAMMRLYKISQDIPSADIDSLDLVTPPHDLLTTASLGGLSVVRPKDGLYSYGAIQNYVRNALRDGYLAKENSSLAVYNATDIAGLANVSATELKSFGYNVTTVASTPKQTNPSATVLVDLTKGKDKYTRYYLEKRLGVSAVSELPPGAGVTAPLATDFVIIVGRDAKTSD
ncbi:MAG: LCP family protein [Candidatus Saccharimonadales bacterium]